MKKLSRKAKRVHKKIPELARKRKIEKILNSKVNYTKEIYENKFRVGGCNRIEAMKKADELLLDMKTYEVCPECDGNLEKLHRVTYIDGFGNCYFELSTMYYTNKNCDFKMEF